MLLENIGQLNDLSPKFRADLEKKVRAFGKQVLYKFNISQENPDPEKREGKVIWPHVYTLDPRRFMVNDPHESREGKSKTKQVGLITEVNEKNEPTKFGKIQVHGRDKGIVRLDLTNNDDFAKAMFLELHPKQSGGQFADKSKHQVFHRVDEKALADDKRKERSEKLKALDAAQKLSDKQVIQFADAMTWDSTDDISIIRSKIEDLAEYEPAYFNEMVAEGNRQVEVMATLKRAVDNRIIMFDPIGYKYQYVGSNQVISVLQPTGDKPELQKLADWILGSGPQGEQAYKKIESLLK